MRLLRYSLAALVFMAVVECGCQPKPSGSSAAQAAADSAHVADSLHTLAQLAVGQRSYLAYCAMCHGNSGNGDGEVAVSLKQKGIVVARLSDGQRMSGLTKTDLAKIISEGGAHTGRSNLMPAWGELLGSDQVDAVTTYVMTLSAAHPAIPNETLQQYLAAPPGTPADGRELFVHHCVACHGDQAKGDGPIGERLWALHKVRPRDLTDSTYIATRSDRELFAVVSRGGGHFKKSTFMPSWTVTLSPAQIRDLVAYIRFISHTAAKP